MRRKTCVSDGLKITFFRNLLAHSSRPVLVVVKANPDQACWALNIRGIHSKKEEALAVILRENGSEDSVKPRISNRQLSVDSGTLLRIFPRSPFTDTK